MKFRFSRIILLLTSISFIQLSTCSNVYANSYSYSSLKDNSYIALSRINEPTTQSDIKTLLTNAATNLEPSITIKVPTNNMNTYSVLCDALVGINSYDLTLTSKGNSHALTVKLEYKQAYKLTQYLDNPSLSSKLSKADFALLNVAKHIVKQITSSSMSDYQKELAIHDYIVNSTSYDYANLAKNTLPDSAYGVLINKKAVCQGYSEAVKLLLNIAGIPCEIVTGSSSSATAHAWNIVKIDNDWYMLDATYDDPITTINDKQTEIKIYEYFNVTNKVLSKDHTWNEANWPIATATKYNYYSLTGNVANNYTEFKNYIIKAINSGNKSIVCYVNNYDPSSYDLDFIFEHYKGMINYSAPSHSSGSFIILLS